jgi:transcriptional repressor NrdR
VEDTLPLIIKKDGRRELFDRTKILSGIKRACEKRPVGIETMEKVVDKIEKEILETGEREIQSSAVGSRVMEELKSLDEVAYVRFASVYREFRDINEFMTELKGLLEISKKKK